MVYDKTHKVFLVHQAGKNWVLVQGEELNPETAGRVSEAEGEFERLWKGFCSSISIKERENLALQRSHLPMHFRQDMTEFSDSAVRSDVYKRQAFHPGTSCPDEERGGGCWSGKSTL